MIEPFSLVGLQWVDYIHALAEVDMSRAASAQTLRKLGFGRSSGG